VTIHTQRKAMFYISFLYKNNFKINSLNSIDPTMINNYTVVAK